MVLETIFASPLLVAALVAVLIVAVHYQRGLNYREYRTAHLVKSRLFAAFEKPIEDRLGAGIVNDKGYRDDEEFIETVDKSPREVFRRVRQEHNASPHLLAATKRRSTPDGSQLTHSQLVKFDDDKNRQTEFYLFDNGDGSTDLYGHDEVSVFNPEDHLKNTDQQPVE